MTICYYKYNVKNNNDIDLDDVYIASRYKPSLSDECEERDDRLELYVLIKFFDIGVGNTKLLYPVFYGDD